MPVYPSRPDNAGQDPDLIGFPEIPGQRQKNVQFTENTNNTPIANSNNQYNYDNQYYDPNAQQYQPLQLPSH